MAEIATVGIAELKNPENKIPSGGVQPPPIAAMIRPMEQNHPIKEAAKPQMASESNFNLERSGATSSMRSPSNAARTEPKPAPAKHLEIVLGSIGEFCGSVSKNATLTVAPPTTKKKAAPEMIIAT